jgi:hypothetical protein
MPQVLFYLNILAVIGTLVMPLTAPTRGRALYDWFVQLLAASMLSYLIETYYPSWEEPHWHTGIVWAIIAWMLVTLGLAIAINKPRKRTAPVA